jgi:hypothetical protein
MNRASRYARGLCASLAVLSASFVLAQDAPAGWRQPTQEEASDEWRDKSPTRFLVVNGDFDGDGKPDTSALFVNSDSNQFALFVKLGATGKWQMADKPVDIMWFGRYGIDLVKPGKYQTACGKSYSEYACSHGESESLKVSSGAINFFSHESSESYFYWDKKEKTFRKVLMTD